MSDDSWKSWEETRNEIPIPSAIVLNRAEKEVTGDITVREAEWITRARTKAWNFYALAATAAINPDGNARERYNTFINWGVDEFTVRDSYDNGDFHYDITDYVFSKKQIRESTKKDGRAHAEVISVSHKRI